MDLQHKKSFINYIFSYISKYYVEAKKFVKELNLINPLIQIVFKYSSEPIKVA